MSDRHVLPEDINPSWLSVIRRLQSVSKSQGLSVVSINILVDENGVPQAWTSPVRTLIEPKGAATAILQLFVNGGK
jgi:hypothetical protein